MHADACQGGDESVGPFARERESGSVKIRAEGET